MKKTIGIILIVVGIITSLIGPIAFWCVISNATANANAANVSIIGGADGPTSYFIAGKIGAPLYGMIFVGIAALVIGLLLVLLKKKQDQ